MTADPIDFTATPEGVVPTRPAASPRPTGKSRVVGALRGQYDAAQTSTDNVRHWSNADHLSAKSAMSPGVRRALRERSRYEVANNGYAHGIIETLANYVIGTGPRLQIQTGNPEVNAKIELLFRRWSRAVKLALKLWVMRFSAAESGESFGVMVTNARSRDAVKLDLRVIECDRVASPFPGPGNAAMMGDGIIFDDFDEPVAYTILRQHPGDLSVSQLPDNFDTVRAEYVVHLFKQTRPEQIRGVPETTPTLSLFADLRRFTQAVIAAAETAANHSGVIQTNTPPPEDGSPLQPMDVVEIERRVLLTLPEGWQAQQMKAEQPTTTYSSFKEEILSEAGRPFNMPFNIAAAKSAGYNFASAKLDFAAFYKSIGIDQFNIKEKVLEPLLVAWLNEARMIPGYLPEGFDYSEPLPHEWMWDGTEQLDPREAGSKATGLAAGIDTLPRLFATRGQDYEAEQIAAAKSFGLSLAEYRKLLVIKTFGNPLAAASGQAASPDGTAGTNQKADPAEAADAQQDDNADE